jgi:uncharacterized protein (TIGR03437 family)
MTKTKKLTYCVISALLPATLIAFSTGPVPRRTGAAVDGGLDCTACHRTFAPANSDPLGKVTITATGYVPGQKQVIKVTVAHPEGQRWGFQLTARTVRDETKEAGTFTPTNLIKVRCDSLTVEAPCNGGLEFAEHAQENTGAGTTGSRTFEIEWTPPSDDVGDVVFYTAGNAANNNGANSGDRIYTTSARIQNAGTCGLTTRPTLRAVSDAASFKPAVAMNSLITLFGLNFQVPGNSKTADSGVIRDNKFPTELGCVAVEVAGRRVPITYVDNGQINAQMPTITSTGPVDVRVILNPGRPGEIRSDVASGIPVQNYAPAFFTFDGKSIAARHANFSIAGNPAVVAGGTPFVPGETVLLYATGLGPTNPVYQAGEVIPGNQTPRLRDPLTVTIGGTTVAVSDIDYAGLTPGSVSGLYQINVKVPASAADGDVPVVLRIGGVESQAGATIPVKRPQ